MKPARVVLLGLGILLALLLVVVAVAFNSSVQTWAARRALALNPELQGSVGFVSFGWSRVQMRDLRVVRDGAVLTLPSLEADVPLLSAGLRDSVQVRRLVAKGWTLDLSNARQLTAVGRDLARHLARATPAQPRPTAQGFSLLSSAYAAEAPAASTEAAAAFRGLFQQLQLPVDVSLDGVELDGEVVLPPHGQEGAIRARVVLQGGQLAAGREGQFNLDLTATKPDGDALSVQAKVTLAMDTPRTFARVGTVASATVSGTKLPAGVKLDITAEATRTATGESYRAQLARAAQQLANVQAELLNATAHISGTWKLDLQDVDLAPFAFGQQLPTFEALGEGGFETDTTFQEVHASGRLKASADHLEILRPELSAVGPTQITADFDVLQHGNSLRVERLTGELSRATAAPVATVRALQPFEFNLSTAELRVADPAQDLVGIVLTGVPIGWAQPFAGDFTLSGGDVRGEFVVGAREGGLALRPKRPLVFTGVTVSEAGRPLLRDLDVTLQASADYTPRGWQAQVVELSVRHRGALLFSLDAKAGQLAGADQAVKVTGRWSADLPGWASQPAVADELQLASGTAQGEFNASLDGTQSIETRLALLNLTAPTKERLPAINVEIRADKAADGRVTFRAPWLVEQGPRKSDLLLSGTFTPGTPATVDARLTGELVHVQDVQMFALLLPEAKAPAPPGTPASDQPGPPWAAIGGQITLALKKVIYGESLEVTDVGGAVRLEPTALRLESVRAVFGPESDLKLTGGVNYNPSAAAAYAFTGDLVVRNLETGPVFRAMDPAKLPTVEARVDVNSHLTGQAPSLAKLAEQTRGNFEVTSKGGVFRALATVLPAERMQTAQSALSIVGGLFGGSTGETVNATLEIVKILSEIPFDQLSLKAERGANLDLLLQDFTLISPDVRLGGAGKLDYVPGRSLLEQSLDLQINLGARGRLGELLSQVKMLKTEKDTLGYSAFSTPIQIGGTLANTDTSDLKNKLLNIAVEKSGVGDALNRILGGGK